MKRNIFTLFIAILLLCLGTSDCWADVHYIAVASDRHGATTYTANGAIYQSLIGMKDLSVEYVCMAGDMVPQRSGSSKSTKSITSVTAGGNSGVGSSSSSSSAPAYNTSIILQEINDVFKDLTASNVSIIYADHDGGYTDDAGIMKCTDSSGSDNNKSGDSQLIYTGTTENGKVAYYIYGASFASLIYETGDGASAFKAWVKTITDTSIPIIVCSHVPLHYASKSGGSDNPGAIAWSEALNYAATGIENLTSSGKDIIRNVFFLHGHYHGLESDMDNSVYPYEYFIPAGSTMKLYDGNTSHYTYYNYTTAGYMAMNYTATLFTIDGKNIKVTKYKKGETPTAPYASTAYGTSFSGTYNTASPQIVTRIVPDVSFADADNGTTTNETLISNYNGKIYDATLDERTLYAGMWNTMCLPFDVDLTDANSPLYGATVKKLGSSSFTESTNTLTINFESVSYMTAGTPYIVKLAGSSNVSSPTFYGVTLSATAAGRTSTSYINFVGCYSPVTLSNGDREKLYLGSNNTLYYPGANVTVNSFRGYFELNDLTAGSTSSKGIRAFNLDFGDEQTNSIVEIESEEPEASMIYTIDGRRLTEMPKTQGLYIKNGRISAIQ